MSVLRPLIGNRPHLFAWLFALAMAVRLLVPTGYMPHVGHGELAIVACPGAMVSAHHEHGSHHDAPDHGTAEQSCAFTGLAAPLLAAIAVCLSLVPLAIVATAASPPISPVRRGAMPRWRPPLRAPPLILTLH